MKHSFLILSICVTAMLAVGTVCAFALPVQDKYPLDTRDQASTSQLPSMQHSAEQLLKIDTSIAPTTPRYEFTGSEGIEDLNSIERITQLIEGEQPSYNKTAASSFDAALEKVRSNSSRGDQDDSDSSAAMTLPEETSVFEATNDASYENLNADKPNLLPVEEAEVTRVFESTEASPFIQASAPLSTEPATSSSMPQSVTWNPEVVRSTPMQTTESSVLWNNQATPGHNEILPMSPDLSLTPPPQPGGALQSYLPNQPPAFSNVQHVANFDPSVGHRHPYPIRRANTYPLDDGEKFGFETKKREFPSFPEIIATGRFFYSAEVMWAEPQFQGNTAIATEAVNFGESIPFDFDSDFHARIRFGFESKYGPGMEFSYFNVNSNSEIADFTSDGIVTGHTNAWVIGRNVWSRIVADDPGEILTSQHSIDIDSFNVSFFKELKFPISRVNGNFGFQYVSIAQQLNANVVSAGGSSVETLQSTTDMRAFGPRAIIEYYRPIGHTPFELVTSFGGAVLFGQRDQFVANSQTGLENRLGADEFLTILDFLAAVQYTKTIGENRSWFARLGFMNQTWIGGGTAAFPQGDFGIRGLTFGIGYNR